MSDPKRTIDEISKEIEDVAFNGEGADKLRALKMLREDRGGTAITLPEPQTHAERVHRMMRIMKAFGVDLCRAAFSEAFPHQINDLGDVAPVIPEDGLTQEEELRALRIKSVKQLYREWPALKRSGTPQGYPRGRGLVAVTAWCQEKARKIIRDEKQSKADAATFLKSLKDEPVVPQT